MCKHTMALPLCCTTRCCPLLSLSMRSVTGMEAIRDHSSGKFAASGPNTKCCKPASIADVKTPCTQ